MKVLLSHNYFLRLDSKQWIQQKPYPPLGTLYAVSSLQAAGHEVIFHDVQFDDGLTEFEEVLEKEKPDYLVLYEDGFNYLTKMCLTNMRDAAFGMLALASQKSIPSIVSGSDSTDRYEEYLQKGASAVIFGEAEETLVDLMSNDSDWSMVKGCAFLKNEKLQNNGSRPVRNNLDSLPQPAWDVLNIKPYLFLLKIK